MSYKSKLLALICSLNLASQAFAQEEDAHHVELANNIHVYLHPKPTGRQWGSFQVVLKYPSSAHSLFRFDSTDPDWEAVQSFFSHAAEAIQTRSSEEISPLFASSTSPLLDTSTPSSLAIIAVGDFEPNRMLEDIEEHFGSLSLSDSSLDPISIQVSKTLEPSKVALSISYPFSSHVATEEDLKSCWKELFIQELLEQRFEECTKRSDEMWIHPHPQGLYPAKGFALVPENEVTNLLAFFLWHLEMVKLRGFYEDSFLMKKNQLLYKLHHLLAQSDPDCSLLSSYYKDQFLFGSHDHPLKDFLENSIAIIESLHPTDLLPTLDGLFERDHRHIHLAYPQTTRRSTLNDTSVMALEQEIKTLAELYSEEEEIDWDFDEWHQFEPTSHKTHSPMPFQLTSATEEGELTLAGFFNPPTATAFYQLPLSDKEKQVIESIITTMAEKNIFQLALMRKDMEKKGDKIDHVHPLRFMGYILSTASLKKDVKAIKKSSFKWDALIDGFSKKMRNHLSKNNVKQYLPGFAETVGCSLEHVESYVNKKDFEGLVKSLL